MARAGEEGRPRLRDLARWTRLAGADQKVATPPVKGRRSSEAAVICGGSYGMSGGSAIQRERRSGRGTERCAKLPGRGQRARRGRRRMVVGTIGEKRRQLEGGNGKIGDDWRSHDPIRLGRKTRRTRRVWWRCWFIEGTPKAAAPWRTRGSEAR
jgi:hypothetical protein